MNALMSIPELDRDVLPDCNMAWLNCSAPCIKLSSSTSGGKVKVNGFYGKLKRITSRRLSLLTFGREPYSTACVMTDLIELTGPVLGRMSIPWKEKHIINILRIYSLDLVHIDVNFHHGCRGQHEDSTICDTNTQSPIRLRSEF